MTRLERIKTGTIEQIADMFCDVVDNLAPEDYDIPNLCSTCPASNTCRNGHNGFIDWLQGEV